MEMYSCPRQACDGASAVLILTAWEAFKYPPSSANCVIAPGVDEDDWLVS